MVNSISAQANVAWKSYARNLARVRHFIIVLLCILATVVFELGRGRLRRIGASHAPGRLSCALFPTMKHILAWETSHVYPEDCASE